MWCLSTKSRLLLFKIMNVHGFIDSRHRVEEHRGGLLVEQPVPIPREWKTFRISTRNHLLEGRKIRGMSMAPTVEKHPSYSAISYLKYELIFEISNIASSKFRCK